MRAFAAFLAFSILSGTPAAAMVTVEEPNQSSIFTATGLYGGITNGNTFLLKLSEQGKLLYYRVLPSLTLLYKGERVGLDRLPPNTPVMISTDKGVVVGVEILGGYK